MDPKPTVFDVKTARVPTHNAEALNALAERIAAHELEDRQCLGVVMSAVDRQAVLWASSLINDRNVKLQVVVREEPLA